MLVVGVCFAIAANAAAAPILLYVGMLLLALVLVAVLSVRLPRRSGEVARQISTDLLTVGDRSTVRVRFALRSLRAPRAIWHDTLPAAVSGDATGQLPRTGDALSYDLLGLQRGVFTLGPLVLRTVDPFGIAQREQAFGSTRPITVVPAVEPLAPLSARLGSAGGTAHTSSSRLGQGSDNLSPRPYAPGDSMRRIHWRATAHRGEPMVRQEEAESSPDAIVVLDRTAPRWGDAGDAGFEAAVSACASVAVHLQQEGYCVDVIDTGGVLLGALRGHEDDRDELLVALASTHPGGAARDIAAITGGSAGPLVVLTGHLGADDRGLLRHGGASVPVILTTDPAPGALEAAADAGWFAALLTDDIAGSWEAALPERMLSGGGRVR